MVHPGPCESRFILQGVCSVRTKGCFWETWTRFFCSKRASEQSAGTEPSGQGRGSAKLSSLDLLPARARLFPTLPRTEPRRRQRGSPRFMLSLVIFVPTRLTVSLRQIRNPVPMFSAPTCVRSCSSRVSSRRVDVRGSCVCDLHKSLRVTAVPGSGLAGARPLVQRSHGLNRHLLLRDGPGFPVKQQAFGLCLQTPRG